MSKQLTPACGYLRKSTKGEHADGRQRQEKSLAQQKAEIEKLADGKYRILKWFEDEGISGWKRGAQRPDFQRMLGEVKALGAEAILCDNIDRFSRSAFGDVQEDANALRKAGVRHIVTASHGEYDLGARYDIGDILKFVVAVWSACEYSRQLSRRITLARRNAAIEGKRTGSSVPYGMVKDGKHSIKPGEPAKIRIVKWLFEEFANNHRSLNWLVSDLNYNQKIPGPTGGKWYVRTVSQLLRRRAYRGDFEFNKKHGGQFFGINGQGEVVDREHLNGEPGKLFEKKGIYEAIVDRALFDKAQKRLNVLAKDRTRRKAEYALSGVLICDHCGGGMYGVRQKGKGKGGKLGPTKYRCDSNHHHGQGTCGSHEIREDRLLPFILKVLSQEMDDLKKLLADPPPPAHLVKQKEHDQADRDKLAAMIARAEENLLLCEDARTRKSLDARITALRDQLEAMEVPESDDRSPKEIEALLQWIEETEATFLPMTLSKRTIEAKLDAECEGPATFTVDPLAVNAALHELGTQVRLRWETKPGCIRSGKPTKKYILNRGRFRLGQQKGRLSVLEPSAGQRLQNLLPLLSQVDRVFDAAEVA